MENFIGLFEKIDELFVYSVQVKQDLCSEAGILSGLVNLLMDGTELAVTQVLLLLLYYSRPGVE